MNCHPISRRPLAAVFALLLPFAAIAQQPERAAPAPADLLRALDLRSGTVQDLIAGFDASQPLRLRVRLGNLDCELDLQPNDVRTAGFRLLVDDGRQLRDYPRPASVTMQGTVVGQADSAVAATVVGGRLTAIVRLADTTWGVQPADQVMPGLPATAHVVYRAADLLPLPFRCGNQEAAQPPQGGAGPLALKIAEIACDADVEFYQLNGSSIPNTQNDVTGIINAMNVIYQRDCEIQHRISTIVVRTTSIYSSNNPSTLLNQFGSYWNSNHGAIRRDLAHLFTGKTRSSGVIGIAFLGVVCNVGSAYGLSWSRFTTNYTARVGLTAHEVGHNWNAGHCDSYTPCNIMCSGLGGCSGNLSAFAPVSIAAIVSFKNSRSCLDDPNPPVITSLSPTSVPSWKSPQIIANGSNLDGVTKVTIGGVDVSGIAFRSPTSLTLNPPTTMPIGTQPVVATNGAGSSPPVNIQVTGLHPSRLEVPAFAVRNFAFDYKVHSDKAWTAALLVSTSNQGSSIPGLVTLGIGNGFTDLLQIASLVANSHGEAAISLTAPGTLPPGLKLYWQAVTYDPANIVLPLEVSDVQPSTLL
jgi:hypothetical protein